MPEPKYYPEVDIQEHDDSAPKTKRVMLYGWDSKNLQKVRIAVNPSGVLQEEDAALTLNYTGDVLTSIDKVVNGVTYRQTLTYTDTKLTNVSAWVEQ